jgi:hypothetical protein
MERIRELEDQFVDYSDRTHDLVFFIRDGLTRNMQFRDLIDMKKGLLFATNEMMSNDQEYMRITRQAVSHPNYDKFMTYMRLAKARLDAEIEAKYPLL